MGRRKLRRQGKNIDELALKLNTLEHTPPAISGVPINLDTIDGSMPPYDYDCNRQHLAENPHTLRKRGTSICTHDKNYDNKKYSDK